MICTIFTHKSFIDLISPTGKINVYAKDNDMKKVVCLLISAFACLQLFSQGIDFKDLTFQEALEQAKIQKKLVFVDCYTSWCGPCKQMAAQVFTQKGAGDFFNPCFVSVKYDMEKGEGKKLSGQLTERLSVYPTFLFFDPEGKELLRLTGGSELKTLIERVEFGLQEQNALAVFEQEFATGKMSKERMFDFVQSLRNANFLRRAEDVADELVKHLTFDEKVSAAYWMLYESDLFTPFASDNFTFLLENKAAFEKNVGATKVNQKLESAYSSMLHAYVVGTAGKDKADKLDVVKRQLGEYDLPGKKYLQTKLALAYARTNGDIDRMISIFEKEIYNLPQKELWTLATSLRVAQEKGNKTQWQQIGELGDKFVDAAKEEDLKGYLKSFFAKFKKLASAGV